LGALSHRAGEDERFHRAGEVRRSAGLQEIQNVPRRQSDRTGANTNDVIMVTGYQKYAQMDGGPFLTQQLGADGAAKLNAKFAPFRTTIEVLVRIAWMI